MVSIEKEYLPEGEMLDIQYQTPQELTRFLNKIFCAASKIPEGSAVFPQAQTLLKQLQAFSEGSEAPLDGNAIVDVLNAAKLVGLPKQN